VTITRPKTKIIRLAISTIGITTLFVNFLTNSLNISCSALVKERRIVLRFTPVQTIDNPQQAREKGMNASQINPRGPCPSAIKNPEGIVPTKKMSNSAFLESFIAGTPDNEWTYRTREKF